MATKKKENISVSFHYLLRFADEDDACSKVLPFSKAEFGQLFDILKNKPKINLKDEKAADRLRSRTEVPIEKIETIDTRTLFGVFQASYWGHSYENTAKGEIPAESISLRPFKFLLYLSEDGKIYICCQYLGQFGGYGGLKTTICDMLSEGVRISARSFRIDNYNVENVQAKEVQVSFSSKPDDITKGNVFTDSGMIAFKKKSKDDNFEGQVADKLLPFAGGPRDKALKAISSILSEGKLIDVADSDIDNCIIIANINGKKKTIYMLEEGSFASKFPLDVPTNADGHPAYEPTKKAMLEVLTEQIISRKQNV